MNSFENVTFSNNNAREEGGAIYYDLYRPVMKNITFINNKAPYGNNIASYPLKVLVNNSGEMSTSLYEVPSGQIYTKTMKLSVVDYDNQVISDLISGTISISPIGSSTNTLGRSSEPIVNGVATFKEIIFVSKPGSKNVPFKITTAAIDKNIIQRQFGKYFELICSRYLNNPRSLTCQL